LGIAENKKIASDLLACFTAGDVAGALDMLSDDATWWIAGKPGQLPVVGTHDKEQIARVFQGMLGQLRNGLRMTVKGAIAEGDKVALEVESHGEPRSGRVYNQEYHMLITIRDGKISAVREYLDTQHVYATWFQP
jgi:uncharacterized protein